MWGTEVPGAVDQGDAVAAWLTAFLGVADLRLVHFNEVSVWADYGVRAEKESQPYAGNYSGRKRGQSTPWAGHQSVCNITALNPRVWHQ